MLFAGAIETSISTPAGTSTKELAVRNAKLSITKSLPRYTSTIAAAASAELCITWISAVDSGNCTKAPPDGNATHNPKAAPLLLLAGFKKPEATTTAAAPCKPNVAKGAS